MECCLAPGELIRVDGGEAGLVLHCTSGTVWLTCGDGRDYLLSAGSRFEIAARRFAVAEALQAVKCTLVKTKSARNSMQSPVMAFSPGLRLHSPGGRG